MKMTMNPNPVPSLRMDEAFLPHPPSLSRYE